MGGMHVAEQWIIQDFLMPIDKLAETVKFRHKISKYESNCRLLFCNNRELSFAPLKDKYKTTVIYSSPVIASYCIYSINF